MGAQCLGSHVRPWVLMSPSIGDSCRHSPPSGVGASEESSSESDEPSVLRGAQRVLSMALSRRSRALGGEIRARLLGLARACPLRAAVSAAAAVAAVSAAAAVSALAAVSASRAVCTNWYALPALYPLPALYALPALCFPRCMHCPRRYYIRCTRCIRCTHCIRCVHCAPYRRRQRTHHTRSRTTRLHVETRHSGRDARIRPAGVACP